MLPEETPSQPEVEPVEATMPAFEPVEPRRDPFWNYTDLVLVIGMIFAAIILIGFGVFAAYMIWPSLRTNPGPLMLPTQVALYFALLLILKLDFSSRYDKPVFRSLGWRAADPMKLACAVAAGAALPFVISGITYLLGTPKVTTQMDELMKQIPIVPMAIVAAVLAPFFEELFFRGFLQPLLIRSFGVVIGVFITGAIFGGVHAAEYSFVWQYVVAISIVGWALGAMRVWANSIVPTTIMHACFNGLQVIAFSISKHP